MKQILYAAGAIAIIALVVIVGVLIGNRLGGGGKTALKPVVTVAPTAAAPAESTSTPVSGAGEAKAGAAEGQTKASTAERVAVPNGRVENETSIAILPVVTLRGDRRYVLQVTSKAGALPFTGSYSRGSIDPKIAIDVKTDIKGTTPWEEEIQPPAADARQWSLGVSLSLDPLGKNVQVQIWDIGPR
jgi:hypothetical protein